MSTPYPPVNDEDQQNSSTTVQPPTLATSDRDGHVHRPSPEVLQGYRPAAPIQRFNNKSLNWPAWFRHFRAVADVHEWSKDQRVLQLVSYLDETAMNVPQDLGDNDLYNYDVLVKLLSDRFDPASRVSAFHSRFHGRSRRHHEDADTFADALSELCRVGYPQSPPEMLQELIAEQFVRGKSDPELKKYLWVVIRTQMDRKLQTLIEVCTDLSSLMTSSKLHRPAEQTFAVHRESYPEDERELEDKFAVGDRPPRSNTRPPEPSNHTDTTTDVRIGTSDGIRDASYRQTDRRQSTKLMQQFVFGPESWVPSSDAYRSGLLQNQVFQLWPVWTYVNMSTAGHVPTVQTCGLATSLRQSSTTGWR